MDLRAEEESSTYDKERPRSYAYRTKILKGRSTRKVEECSSEPPCLRIHFEDTLKPIERVVAIRSALEYLLYHRYQIPQPFSLLRREGIQTRNESTNGSRPGKHLFGKSHRENQKRQYTLKVMDDITDGLSYFFRHCNVLKVVLVLGSTVFSPRELFVLSMIPSSTENNNDVILQDLRKSPDRISMQVGRFLVTSPDLQKMNNPLSPTNGFVLVLVSSNMDDNIPPHFTPKHRLNVLERGKRFDIMLTESTEQRIIYETNKSSFCDLNKKDFGDMTYIWYQSKDVFKGYTV